MHLPDDYSSKNKLKFKSGDKLSRDRMIIFEWTSIDIIVIKIISAKCRFLFIAYQLAPHHIHIPHSIGKPSIPFSIFYSEDLPKIWLSNELPRFNSLVDAIFVMVFS